MMYYITYVFTMAGLTGNNLLVSSSIQYVINVVMTVPALLFIDRWGRRPTLLVGALLMATWLFANAGILGAYGTYEPNGIAGTREASTSVSGAASKGVIACSYLFVASYAPTWVRTYALKYQRTHFANLLIGPCLLDLPSRTLPSPRPRQGRRPRNLSKLGLQLRPGLLRPSRLRQHPMENLHHFRRLLHRHVHSRLLHVPRNRRQASRGSHGDLREPAWHQVHWYSCLEDAQFVQCYEEGGGGSAY